MPKRSAVNLTPTRVSRFRFKPGGPTLQRLWDSAVPGLGIEAVASGRRSWVLRYRIGDRQRIITLGAVADLDLDAARDRAVEARAAARQGQDPQIARDAPQRALTLTALWEQYQTTPHYLTRSPDFRAGMESTLRVYVLPAWGHIGVAALKRWQIRDAVERLIVQGKEGAARGLLNRLRTLLNYALERELIQASPADHIRPQYTTTGRRAAWLETPEQIRDAWYLDGPIQVRGMVRWMLLTGCRRDEARLARWDQIQGDVWRVASTKNDNPLVLPIMPDMQAVLDEMRATFGPSDWIFPSTVSSFKPIPRGTWDYALRTATNGRFSAHVLRHTVESWLRELGLDEEHRDMVLNHVRRGTGSRYAHGEQIEAKREALRIWHKHVQSVTKKGELRAVG